MVGHELASISYLPWKEIIIHEIQEMQVQLFLESMVGQIQAQGLTGTPSVFWLDGIAFYKDEFLETPEIVKDKLEGKLHWGILHFTRTSYQPENKVTVNGRESSVKMVKAENNADFSNLVKFLNSKFPVTEPKEEDRKVTLDSPQRKPCEFHIKNPCGQLGEAVEFSDGVRYICEKGKTEWNATHVNKIVTRGSPLQPG